VLITRVSSPAHAEWGTIGYSSKDSRHRSHHAAEPCPSRRRTHEPPRGNRPSCDDSDHSDSGIQRASHLSVEVKSQHQRRQLNHRERNETDDDYSTLSRCHLHAD
jgi:hypothetical protein